MARPVWKGAISFSLIHIPVGLYPATKSVGIDLDLLDRKDFAPVGYQRYNKTTGRAELTDFWHVLTQDTTLVVVFHTLTAAFLTGALAFSAIVPLMTVVVSSVRTPTDASTIVPDEPIAVT